MTILIIWIGVLIFCLGLAFIPAYSHFKKRRIRGKYIIVHYVDANNNSDDVDEDRVKQLNTAADVLEKDLGLDMTPLELHMMRYKANYGLKNKYDDVVEELFIPVQRGQHTHIEVLDFNKPKVFVKVNGPSN